MDKFSMKEIKQKIERLQAQIIHYRNELNWLLEKRSQEEVEYHDRLNEIKLLEDDLDDINYEIDDRLVVMDASKEEALDLVEVFKNMPNIAGDERKEIVSDIRLKSNEYKEEKAIIEELLDEIDSINDRIDILEALGDSVLANIENEIITKEENIKQAQFEIDELQSRLHDFVVDMSEEVIAILKKRSAGNPCDSYQDLIVINSDISDKLKYLEENAEEVLGVSIEDYLMLHGVLR